MKVFVAGATGAIGRRLVPVLVDRGHEVVAMTRSRSKEGALREAGAEPVVADGLDRAAVVAAVSRAEPEVVVHEMTALAAMGSLRNFDAEFAVTNRLRSEGTDNLVEAARLAGARRIVAQSFAGWNYARVGGPVKTEEAPIDADPPRSMRESLAAIKHAERAVAESGLEGIALRYGALYGAGTGWTSTEFAALLDKRRIPIIGDGAGIVSFIHVDDAAIATAAAVERGAPGVYNIADDEPAPVGICLPAIAAAVGAPAPRRMPAWLARLLAGEAVVTMFTRARGASNAKAKRELGWLLRHPTWREGFAGGLGAAPLAAADVEALIGRAETVQFVDETGARRESAPPARRHA
jgi:nucleoside-diphosphate-sugar epimerase